MLNLRSILFRAYTLSKVLTDNFTDVKNFVNNLQTQINNILTPPAGSEVPNARDFYPVLRDRLQGGFKASRHSVITGGIVSAQASPNMTVKISSGEALISGVGIVFTAQNSPTITAPTNFRYDVVVINSDSSITVLAGNDSVDPALPAVADTQIAVAIIRLTSGTTTITNSIIEECSRQGCVYFKSGIQQYEWKISDAVADLLQGDIYIGPGSYYEEVNLTAISQISLIYAGGAKHYRRASAESCVKSLNSLGNETERTKIIGGEFYGNAKTGSLPNLNFDYTFDVTIDNAFIDPNSSSTATNPRFSFTNSLRSTIEPEFSHDDIRRKI